MSINPNTQFPGKIDNTDPDYPYGKAQDITVSGDGTGTPWRATLLNDHFGAQQALLKSAGIVPSGTADKVGASQYLQSIVELASGRAQTYDAGGTGNVITLAARTNQQSIASLFDGMRVRFTAIATNTGATTANTATLGVKNVVTELGAALAGGEIIIGNEYVLFYDLINYVLLDPLQKTGGTVTGQIKGITPVAASDLTRKDYVDSLNVITLSFTSAEQPISDNGSITIPHGMSVYPEIIRTYAVCKTTEHGYIVGDRVELPIGVGIPSNEGLSIRSDATDILLRYASDAEPLSALSLTTGNIAPLTNANWRVIVKTFS